MNRTGWTPERVEALKRMWTVDGLSASSIAARLGLPSRSAVCGKAFRLGLSHRNPTQRNPVKGRRRASGASPKPPAARVRAMEKALHLPPRPARSFARDLPKASIPAISDDAIPLHQRKSLLDLEPHHCRWPIGDPQSAEFAFCGGTKVTGLPYCECHAKRAYASPEARPRTIRKIYALEPA